ncbi:MAG TPA: hypothetical protein VF883_16345 [Thermoanaerobaculia bacterium]|jgi:hypothetical protein
MLETLTIHTSQDSRGVPEIERVEYNLWELRVSVRLSAGEPPVYVIFAAPNGFRVLDEGNLNEFWSDAARSSGWIWEVSSGRWLDQESQRRGFIREMTPGNEYLVLGQNDCISVISPSPPRIVEAG